MDKEQEQKPLDDNTISEPSNEASDQEKKDLKETVATVAKEEENEKIINLDERLKELEDKLARTFAEMENQRRRFEKEKEDAFEYGGFSFAREALNLIDNLQRSKQVLENDEK